MIEDSIQAENPAEAPAPEMRATLAEKSWLLAVTAAVLILDFVSKLLVEIWLPLNRSWVPLADIADFFRITHISNTGAAFGIFPSGSSIFMFVAIIVSAIIIIYNHRLPRGHYLFRMALGLQLGGALGNLTSRVRLGHVTDFLDFGPVPVFNIADASIVVGVIVLGLLMVLEDWREKEPVAQEVEPAPAKAGEEQAEPLEERGMLWNE